MLARPRSMSSIEGQCTNHYAMEPSVIAINIIPFVEFAEFSEFINSSGYGQYRTQATPLLCLHMCIMKGCCRAVLVALYVEGAMVRVRVVNKH